MRLLERIDEISREVRVVELIHDGSRLYYDRGVLYTGIDAAGNNILEYVHAMHHALRGTRDVLLLGTAGGALASELHRSGAQVTAVDSWPGAFDLARRWFHLPRDVACVEADAAAFLKRTDGTWSGVAVDVFDGLQIPSSVLSEDFARTLLRVLAPGGRIVWNVAAGAHDLETRRVLRLLRRVGLTPRTHPVRGDPELANTLVLAEIS